MITIPPYLRASKIFPDWLYEIYSDYQRIRQEERYFRLQERYSKLMEKLTVGTSEKSLLTAIRMRAASCGRQCRARATGDYHTFAFIPQVSWHRHLMPDLYELGKVSLYDYSAAGYRSSDFWYGSAKGVARRKRMNQELVAAVKDANRTHRIDWMLFYCTGSEVLKEALEEIRQHCQAPMALMCLDDKQSWELHEIDGQNAGQIDIVKYFDFCWSSARSCLPWYICEGAVPFYLPEGFNASAYRPMKIEKTIDISFVGAKYGFRGKLVAQLRRLGISVSAYGDGWENPSVWGDKQVEVFNRSRINLGAGGILHSEELTNVKTRDFEVPGTGGGAYLTSYNKDLSKHFNIGEEIFCYKNISELVDYIRELDGDSDRLDLAAKKARARCLSEHRWLHRYKTILTALED